MTELLDKALSDYFDKSSDAIRALAANLDTVKRMARGIYESQLAGGKLLIGGNGGSCADAEHFAGEMTCTFKDRGRRGFSAMSLTNSASAITAWTNDFGFDTFFVRQVEALGQPGDILFLITTGGGERKSGASMNLVTAAEKAQSLGMKVYAIAGKTGGELGKMADEFIKVPSFVTSHIQEVHIACIHAICLAIDVLARHSISHMESHEVGAPGRVKALPIDIYADGPTLEEITSFDPMLVCGYTFNPTLFRMLKVTDYLAHCRKLIQICGEVPVSLEVVADDAGEMVRQARILGSLGTNVYVKIPITFCSGETTLPVIDTLINDGLNLNITAVFNKAQVQGILPIIRDSGTIISVFAGRLFDIGINATEATREIATLVHKNSKCRVLWASSGMVYDIKSASVAGCDIITMPAALIKKIYLFNTTPEEYSMSTVRMFYDDAKASGYKL